MVPARKSNRTHSFDGRWTWLTLAVTICCSYLISHTNRWLLWATRASKLLTGMRHAQNNYGLVISWSICDILLSAAATAAVLLPLLFIYLQFACKLAPSISSSVVKQLLKASSTPTRCSCVLPRCLPSGIYNFGTIEPKLRHTYNHRHCTL